MNTLISAAELAAKLADESLVLLDVRWVLGRDDGQEHYAAGHIPGAVFVEMETELSGATGAHTGRHPLPEPADFEAAARRWGIGADSFVVAYDDSGALAAARAWWLLRHAGFENVAVLDGGLDAWKERGGHLATGIETREPSEVALSWGGMPVLEYQELASYSGTLIDSRATARYLGIQEPIDPVAGHIPGARNRPTTDNLDAQAKFFSAERLAAAFAKIAPENLPLAAYCGSGITATHQVLAAEHAGRTAALYPGSWSQYCSYPQSPIATSDEQHRH
ncbi:sulfurtransferase [Arthrobacter sp. MYb211]|uniref:sulfurtransferase n=1 Tax=unclassified Arthrobacter TaxID=235627 RepID=UPI000CFD7FF7|nr:MULTISPECIES: sulfurtransferase [unclassified Arthrobacter]PRA08386.1 sulfurtransferase [Arthrobacter sp. MYb221]PRC03869.1 sulfurtransferase [Arthrobacter sp. MYb211]